MNADGSNQHMLLAEPDFDDERPSFAPDGSAVVFSRCRTDIEACGLYQIGTDGTVLRPITNFELGIQDFSPQYSSGGSLAFTGVSHKGIICAIYVNNQESAQPQLTPAPLSA